MDIAAGWAGITPVLLSEIEPYACSILRKRWENIQNVGDITRYTDATLRELGGFPFYPCGKCPADDKESIDIIYGGFPCQDVSVAGKQRGLSGKRSRLWFEMLRVIREIRPRWVLAENVRGAVNLALDTVKAGLEQEGYKVWAFVIPASAVGAPHQRERLFVIGCKKSVCTILEKQLHRINLPFVKKKPCTAVSKGAFWPTPTVGTSGSGHLCGGTGHWQMLTQHLPLKEARKMGAGNGGKLNPDWVENLMGFQIGWTDIACNHPISFKGWPALINSTQYPYEPPRTIDCIPYRAQRLKCLGNAVVPQQAYPFFRAVRELNVIYSSCC